MKKLFLGLAFLGILAFAFPNQAKAESPCATWTITCGCDGSQHYAIVCDEDDFAAWHDLLCCPLAD